MSEASVQKLSPQRAVSAVLKQPNQEQIEDATACFATDFRYQDHGIGLEFRDKERLAEFFRKARELYPDYFVQADHTLVGGDYVVTEWTLKATFTEPFYSALSRKVPISLHGASIVRIENGKITDWADYYDGLTSPHTALSSLDFRVPRDRVLSQCASQ